jgi:hypothetical protein
MLKSISHGISVLRAFGPRAEMPCDPCLLMLIISNRDNVLSINACSTVKLNLYAAPFKVTVF